LRVDDHLDVDNWLKLNIYGYFKKNKNELNSGIPELGHMYNVMDIYTLYGSCVASFS